MKAPKYQRADMLAAALQEAMYTLDDPIEGLEVIDYGADGAPILGGGAWSTQYVADCDASYRLF
jgi:hypothetical protein